MADALYPDIEPFRTGRLPVSHGHDLYFEESGHPKGKPVVFIHGGPGGGTDARQRRFFNPQRYRIILMDQRGCGRSRPHASLEANTTWHLVEDLEALRKHLSIERWQAFGGSWGSTLALAYAQKHPQVISELVLRGIFLLRQREISWFYQDGASALFPDAWEHFLEPIPEAERHDLLGAYYRRLIGADTQEQLRAARAWSVWEGTTSRLIPDPTVMERFSADRFALAFARIEAHYFFNRGFLHSDAQLLDDVHRIRHIPAVLVQGRYDVVCPMESAWALHKAWPEASLRIVPDAGHAAFEPGITHALVDATDAFSDHA